MHQVEDIRKLLKDHADGFFNPQIVRDLLKHYDAIMKVNKKDRLTLYVVQTILERHDVHFGLKDAPYVCLICKAIKKIKGET